MKKRRDRTVCIYPANARYDAPSSSVIFTEYRYGRKIVVKVCLDNATYWMPVRIAEAFRTHAASIFSRLESSLEHARKMLAGIGGE